MSTGHKSDQFKRDTPKDGVKLFLRSDTGAFSPVEYPHDYEGKGKCLKGCQG
jgi:hypothetical protein